MGLPLNSDTRAQLQATVNNRTQYYRLLAADGVDDQSPLDWLHPLRCDKQRSPSDLFFAKSQGLTSVRQCLAAFNPKAE